MNSPVAATGRSRPTIVKLHGDAMLAPLNRREELAELSLGYREILDRHLRDRALIFIGYGGHDKGVTSALEGLRDGSISRGVYWVGDRLPDSGLGVWLQRRPEVVWVPHLDFDELMAVIKDVFDLPHPEGDRFEALIERYQETFATLQGEVDADETTPEVVRNSVDSARAKFESWFTVQSEARRHTKTDPDQADQIYRAGLQDFPESAPLLDSYAIFLSDVRSDHESADAHFKLGLAADPGHAGHLGNYAVFLTRFRGDHDAADKYYQRALEADPTSAGHLGNYALFLTSVRKDHDAAETYYQRALNADATHANNLTNYALFLTIVRKDHDAAETHYQRALNADPTGARHLGNYAGFLALARGDHDAAETYYQRALKADPTNSSQLGNYASFLTRVRGDHDAAETYYRQALEADPTNAEHMGNYAGLLWGIGRSEEANSFMAKIRDAKVISPELQLEILLYRLANDKLGDGEQTDVLSSLHSILRSGVRTPGWNFDLNIKQAEREGLSQRRMVLLRMLATVAADNDTIEQLSSFPEWAALDQGSV